MGLVAEMNGWKPKRALSKSFQDELNTGGCSGSTADHECDTELGKKWLTMLFNA